MKKINGISGLLTILLLNACNSGGATNNNELKAENSFTGEEIKANGNEYSGSMAMLDQSTAAGETVSNSNGSFSFNFPVLDFKILGNLNNILNTTYSQHSGWNFSLPFINVNSNPKLLQVNGAQYIIDTYAPTGLKYVANKSNRFDSWGMQDLGNVCNNSSRALKYSYSYKNNDIGMYFDMNGKLLAVADEYKNCNVYKYDTFGRLINVIDNYGQKYTINHGTTEKTILAPDNKIIAKFHFIDANRVDMITDALGHQVKFEYQGELIKKISYPTGLTTTIDYKSIPYSIAGSNKSQSVVNKIAHKAKGGAELEKTSYYYGEATFNRNFMGYGKYQLGNDKDNMMEDNNSNYVYDVKTIKTDGKTNRITQNFYNFLHLPVKTVIKNGSDEIIVENVYKTEYIGISKTRRAYYTQPVTSETRINGRIISKIENQYSEDYAIPLRIKEFDGNRQILETTDIPDTKYPWLVASNEVKEMVNGHRKRIDYTYTNKQSIKNSKKYYDSSLVSSNSYNYYDDGSLKSETFSAKDKDITTGYVYNYNSGNYTLTTSITDPIGKVSTLVNNTILPGTPLIKLTNPNNKSATAEYDALGQLTKYTSFGGNLVTVINGLTQRVITYPSGYSNTYEYDELGRMVHLKDNDGSSNRLLQSIGYNNFGEIETTTDALLNLTTSYAHDAWGRVTRTIDPAGLVTNNEYLDAQNKIITKINGKISSEKILDNQGNVINEVSHSLTDGKSLGHVNTYDGFGRITQKNILKDGGNYQTITYSYDGDDNIVQTQVTGFDGVTVNTVAQYDALGDINSSNNTVRDHQGKTTIHSSTKLDYDKVGNIASMTDQLGKITKYEHDANGNLIKTSYDGGKQTITYNYDANDLLLSETITNSYGSNSIGYSYDTMGNMLTKTLGDKTYIFNYNQLGTKLKSVKYPNGRLISYDYHPNNDLLKETVDNSVGVTKTYGYDGLGAIKSIALNSFDTLTYDYGVQNGIPHILTSTTLKSGNEVVYNNSYQYDGWMLPQQKITSFGSKQVVTNNSFNSLKQLEQRQLNNGIGKSYTNTYHYDSLSRLINNQHSGRNLETFTYDAHNNVQNYTDFNGKNISLSYNGIGQIVNINGKPVHYDELGNLQQDDSGYNYTFNAKGELTKVEIPGVGFVSYIYLPEGLLQSRTFFPLGSGGKSIVHNFNYSPEGNLIDVSEQGLNGSARRYNLFGVGNELLGLLSPSSSINNLYYLNSNNSSIAIMDIKGTLKNEFEYSAYGQIMFGKESSVASSFGYNQQYTDVVTGLVYSKARWYDPKKMSFISKDSWEHMPNWYAYSNANPIGNWDPSGHAPTEQWVNLGVSITGTTLAVIGAVAATVATGGAAAPLTISAKVGLGLTWASAATSAAAVGASTTGIIAEDNGNNGLARAMHYTAIGLNTAATVMGLGSGAAWFKSARMSSKIYPIGEPFIPNNAPFDTLSRGSTSSASGFSGVAFNRGVQTNDLLDPPGVTFLPRRPVAAQLASSSSTTQTDPVIQGQLIRSVRRYKPSSGMQTIAPAEGEGSSLTRGSSLSSISSRVSAAPSRLSIHDVVPAEAYIVTQENLEGFTTSSPGATAVLTPPAMQLSKSQEMSLLRMPPVAPSLGQIKSPNNFGHQILNPIPGFNRANRPGFLYGTYYQPGYINN